MLGWLYLLLALALGTAGCGDTPGDEPAGLDGGASGSDRDRDGVPDLEDGCPDGEISRGLLVRGCACAAGFSAAGLGERCLDIDECAIGNGGCGSFRRARCVDRAGVPPLCEDIDECAFDHGGCGDPAFVRCVNQLRAPVLCDDINECETDNGGCGDPLFTRCINELAAAPSCVDVDECATDNGGCGDPELVACFNREAAPPLCDTDECAIDNGGCGELGCIDQPGAPPLCDLDECATEPLACAPLSCRNTLGRYRCACPEGTEDVLGNATRCATQVKTLALLPDGLCAAGPSGAGRCWGGLTVPSVHFDHADKLVAGAKLCALSNGEVSCWWNDDDGLHDSQWREQYQDVAVGNGTVCGIRATGQLYCVDGGMDLLERAPDDLVQVSARGEVICVRRTAGEVLCSGAKWAEDAAAEAGSVSTVEVGQLVCVVEEAGDLRCWGPESGFRIAAGQARDHFVQVGGDCALRASGQALCWDGHGRPLATALTGAELTGVMGIPGSYCGSAVGGGLRCSGGAALMDARADYRALRVVAGGVCARQAEGCEECTPDVKRGLRAMGFEGCSDRLAFSGAHGCLVREDHKLQCWSGPEGKGIHVYGPMESNGNYREVQVASGVTCALTTESKLRCWGGDSNSGATIWLGAETPEVEAFTTSAQFVCGIKKDGMLQCWGEPGAMVEGPQGSINGSRLLRLSSTTGLVCAVDTSGQASCWGATGRVRVYDDVATIVNGGAILLYEDGRLNHLTGPYSALAGDERTYCALRPHGTLSCFGETTFDTAALLITR